MMVELDLPELTEEERAHSARLAFILREKIKKCGYIPFSEYFNNCLYHSELGYYTGLSPKFGEEGDFITAPTLSPLFSYCLANQLAEILPLCDEPSILEVGAGNGRMACDIITQLKKLEQLPKQYMILEISPALRKKQYELLSQEHPDFIEHIIWLEEASKTQWQGCIIGNEIVDALSVERFIIKNGKPYYLDVSMNEEGLFVDYIGRQDKLLNDFMEQLAKENIILPDNYVSEFSAVLKPWLATLTESLSKGVVILIDYGYSNSQYYMSSRVTGTLIAHFKHRVHNGWNILQGLQDLTANVNFSLLAQAGLDVGLDFLGYTSQSYFLYGNGLESLLTDQKEQLTDIEWYKVAQSVQHLVLPTEMGERFKVLAMGKNIEILPQGFELYDMSHQL